MMNKDIFNKEFLRVVAADLDYIIKEWGSEIDDDSLRRDCVILRRLLVEDNPGQAWRAVGFEKQPKILTPSLKTIGDRKSADFTQAGGGRYGGVEIRDVEFHSGSNPPGEYTKKGPGLYVKKELPSRMARKPLRLSDFLSSTCITVQGIELSRQDLIIYVANTLGGAHIDRERDFKKQPKRVAKFKALDSILKTTETANKEAIYYELLSIGQSLTNSRDTHKLMKKIKQTVGG